MPSTLDQSSAKQDQLKEFIKRSGPALEIVDMISVEVLRTAVTTALSGSISELEKQLAASQKSTALVVRLNVAKIVDEVAKIVGIAPGKNSHSLLADAITQECQGDATLAPLVTLAKKIKEMQPLYQDIYFDAHGQFKVYTQQDEETVVFSMGGRIEKKGSQPFFERITGKENVSKVLLPPPGETGFNYVLDLSKVTYIQSTPLNTLAQLMDAKKEFLIICGIDSENPNPDQKNVIEGLESVGIFPDEAEGVFFVKTLEEAAAKAKFSEGLKRITAENASALKEGYKAIHDSGKEIKVFSIIAGHLKDPSDQAVMNYVKESGIANYLEAAGKAQNPVIKAERTHAACLYAFLRHVLEEVNRFGDVPNGFSEGQLEVIATELMQNAVEHGYQEKPGIVALSHYITESFVGIRVTDYGAGFDQQKREERQQLIQSRKSAGGAGIKRIGDILAKTGGEIETFSPANPSKTEIARAQFAAANFLEPDQTFKQGPGTMVEIRLQF